MFKQSLQYYKWNRRKVYLYDKNSKKRKTMLSVEKL